MSHSLLATDRAWNASTESESRTSVDAMAEDEITEYVRRPPHPAEALVARLLSPQRGEAWVQFRKEMYERGINRAAEVLDTASEESGLDSPDLLERVRAD